MREEYDFKDPKLNPRKNPYAKHLKQQTEVKITITNSNDSTADKPQKKTFPQTETPRK